MDRTTPAVSCSGCGRVWNSASMVEGLRLLDACPRCGGELSFADDEPPASAFQRSPSDATLAVAPHLVLGIPRQG